MANRTVPETGDDPAAKQREHDPAQQIRRVMHPEIEPGESNTHRIEKNQGPPAVFREECPPEQGEGRCGVARGKGRAAGYGPHPLQTGYGQKGTGFLKERLEKRGAYHGQGQSKQDTKGQRPGFAEAEEHSCKRCGEPDGVGETQHQVIE